ncbi:MAG: DUF2336 domain-containing protein [Alphaproteobacteria bacterium]|nr:DUF2336 domain-containing protein [Alphaproteobacteria bacterium]
MLTEAHIRALREAPSPTVRADIAAAVAADFAAGQLTAQEAQIAEEIIARLVQDAERRVRQALAEYLKDCPTLPPEIAAVLARDIEDEVALPILQHSPLLSEADLVLYARSGTGARRLAVARRKSVAAAVADALLETGQPEIVGAVLANDGAELSEPSLLKIAIRFRGEPPIAALLVERPALPLAVCEVLIASVSKALRNRLVEKHQIPRFLAEELALHGRERAIAALIEGASATAAEELAEHLHRRGRMTPTLVFRSLCLGDHGFFEAAMAALAGIAVAHARTLLYERALEGQRAIYQRAHLPAQLFPAFRVAVGAVVDGRLKAGRAAYTRFVADRLARLYGDTCPASLEQVLTLLARHNAPADRALQPALQ